LIKKQYRPAALGPDGDFDPNSSHGIMGRLVGDGKRVLEVGCATGYMSEHLSRRGNRVTGVDIDEEAAQEARLHCEEVIVADLDSRPLAEFLEGKQYDVAVFGDVLEHLRDPWRVLRDTRPFLSPNGFVVISVPNVAHGNVRLSLLRGAFDSSPLGILDDTHLHFFTLRTARELCLRAGYRIDAIERVKMPLFFDTDVLPQVDERDFGRAVVDDVRRDPEHDTLQFVVRATPVRDYEHLDLTLDALAKVEIKFADAAGKIARLECQLEDLSARLTGAEAARDGLSTQLAEAEARLQAQELAAAESLAELRRSLGARVIELTTSVYVKSRALAGLTQEHAAAVASARTAEEKAAEALEELRRENASLRAAQRESEAARDELSRQLAEAEELARERDAAAVASLAELRRSIDKSPCAADGPA
jgi:SAM-dependent methyltransferase